MPNLGFIVREGEIQKNLIEQFQKNNVKNFWGEALLKIDYSLDEIVCKTSKQTLKTKMIIGCDGMNSKVRELSGIDFRSWSYNQTAIVTNFKS